MNITCDIYIPVIKKVCFIALNQSNYSQECWIWYHWAHFFMLSSLMYSKENAWRNTNLASETPERGIWLMILYFCIYHLMIFCLVIWKVFLLAINQVCWPRFAKILSCLNEGQKSVTYAMNERGEGLNKQDGCLIRVCKVIWNEWQSSYILQVKIFLYKWVFYAV